MVGRNAITAAEADAGADGSGLAGLLPVAGWGLGMGKGSSFEAG